MLQFMDKLVLNRLIIVSLIRVRLSKKGIYSINGHILLLNKEYLTADKFCCTVFPIIKLFNDVISSKPHVITWLAFVKLPIETFVSNKQWIRL